MGGDRLQAWAAPHDTAHLKSQYFTSQVKGLIPLGCFASESLGNSRIFSREAIFKKKTKSPVADPGKPPQAQMGVTPWKTQGHLAAGSWRGSPPRIALHLHPSQAEATC